MDKNHVSERWISQPRPGPKSGIYLPFQQRLIYSAANGETSPMLDVDPEFQENFFGQDDNTSMITESTQNNSNKLTAQHAKDAVLHMHLNDTW